MTQCEVPEDILTDITRADAEWTGSVAVAIK